MKSYFRARSYGGAIILGLLVLWMYWKVPPPHRTVFTEKVQATVLLPCRKLQRGTHSCRVQLPNRRLCWLIGLSQPPKPKQVLVLVKKDKYNNIECKLTER